MAGPRETEARHRAGGRAPLPAAARRPVSGIPCDSALDVAAAYSAIRAYALSLPETWEDFPWGEAVFKVGRKVFLFTGTDKAGRTGFSVKLPRSAAFALLYPFAEKTGYGLGRSDWVTCRFGAGEEVPTDMLCEWVAQSYRAVAPKKLAAKVPDDSQGL